VTEHLQRLSSALASSYRIERELGAGGMATVYLAEDVRHRRKVALKLLHPELSAVLGVERFLKEIELTASLQHPHILPLFDSGSADGQLFYVMPYVEGETLRARLDREAQLPIDDALRIASETADALQYAHDRGVIHRDIKPENILLQNGHAVVADFGIALAVSNAGGTRITQTGLSLGSPQYMSPEQATGDRIVDGRTDVYSLGAVLYEMLTGEPPHSGATAQAIIAKLLTEEPRSVALRRTSVPAHVDRAVMRAITKLAADRWPSVAGFAEALRNPHLTAAMAPIVAAHAARSPKQFVPWTIAAVAVGAAALFAWLAFKDPHAATTPIAAALLPPTGEEFAEMESFGQLSPDGRQFVFATQTDRGNTALWLRSMSARFAERIVGTDGALAPFWSPDGKSIAYFHDGNLVRMDVPGGAPRILCPARGATSGVWNADGAIVFGSARGIERGTADGGQCNVAVAAKSGESFRHPTLLPDGRHVLVSHRSNSDSVFDILAVDLVSGDRRQILNASAEPTFIAPRTLVYGDFRRQRLLAVQFDARAIAVRGEAVPVSDSVRNTWGVFSYTISNSGLLVYLAHRGVAAIEPTLLTTGAGVVLDTIRYRYAWTSRLAGARALLALGSENSASIYDLDRNSETPLVRGWATYPQWSPGDSAIATTSLCAIDVTSLRSGETKRVADFPNDCPRLSDWSRDGRYLVMARHSDSTSRSAVWLYDLVARKPSLLLGGSSRFTEATISPDGRWLAYVSTETGSQEVFLRPFLSSGAPERVSTSSGRTPRWLNDSRTLVYITALGRVVEVPVVAGNRIAVGASRVRFTVADWARSLFTDVSIPYDVNRDGTRFVVFGGSPNVAMVEQDVLAPLAAGSRRRP
jgi:eukaryotic-like serine/threonine-protein kinase